MHVDYPRRVLIVGNGGRENALGNAILASPQVERLLITPPCWGLLDPLARSETAHRATCLGVGAIDIQELVAVARQEQVDLVVIGPEAPLVAGLADELRSVGIPCVGPGADAARLEGSKSFAKGFMQRHGIPTASHRVFTGVQQDATPLREYIESQSAGLVLKCDGLAAGKGVMVCRGQDEALAAFDRIVVRGEFGEAGGTVVVEELLEGPEISFTCLLAGGRAEILPPSSDYKRLQDNDEGPNTGGMGNICPTPYATDEVIAEFAAGILAPTLRGLREEAMDYRGFLFVGTMLTPVGLRVIEYNVRFGDPEAAVVIPLCETDWPALLLSIAQGEMQGGSNLASAIKIKEESCVAVVLASSNYPVGQSDPAVIQGLERLGSRDAALGSGLIWGDDGPGPVQVLFAGVSAETAVASYQNYDRQDCGFLATGGRVLTISARGKDLSQARRLAYEVAGNLNFAGMQMRSDIGKIG